MLQKNIFFIVKQLYPTAGGLTKSLYNRASFLANFHNVTILTTDFQLQLEKVHQELIAAGKLSEKVIIKNLFLDIAINNNKTSTEILKHDYEEIISNLNSFNLQIIGNNTRVFSHVGLYQCYISKYDDGNYYFIDMMNERDFSLLEKRYHFYKNNIFSLEVYNHQKEKKQQVIFNQKNVPILNLWYDKNIINRVFDLRNNTIHDSNIKNIIKSWLNSFIQANDIIFFDSDFSLNTDYFKEIKCKKIIFIHSHQDYCNDTKFLKTFSDVDKFVFLTRLQQNDFKILNYDVFNKSEVIPHPVYDIIDNRQEFTKRKKIVTISRLVSSKPIISAIHAFSKIVDQFNDYIYEIYGTGNDYDKLSNLIKELNMQDKIFLKGYTNNTKNIFSESQLSISLTNYEGFGLSILESLSMNCPVITSNVKYGPNEMIKNGINGFLVENNDIDNISESIIKILENPVFYQNNCQESIKNYNINVWQQKILALIK